MNVHHEMANAATGAELDLGVSTPHAREAVNTIDYDFISLASDALDGDGVAAEPRDESILLPRPGGAARDDRQHDDRKRAKNSEV
jgi:hypothetical protein